MGAALLTLARPADALAGSTPTPKPTPPPPFSLTVSPARLVVPAGATVIDRTVTVANTGSEAQLVAVTNSAFSQAPDGAISFSDRAPYSAASWVAATPTAMDLSPGERQPVRLHIVIPSDPEPGEHQVGVIFLVRAGGDDRNVALNRGVAVELLIVVPGAVDRRIGLGRLQAPRLADGGPVRVSLPIYNRGNVHRDYIGRARLVADAAGARAPFPDFTVLRDSTRVVSTHWTPPFACVCHLRVVTDDGRGHRLMATATVVVFPFRLTIGLAALIFGLALLSRSLRRRSRGAVQARVAAARQEAYEQAHRELAAAGSSGSQPSMPDRS